MNIQLLLKNGRILLLACVLLTSEAVFSQSPLSGGLAISNPYGIPAKEWTSYLNKTNILSERIDVHSFINYIFFAKNGDFADMTYFLDYVKGKLNKDKEALIYKVGKGEVTTPQQITEFYVSLQPKYEIYYSDFLKRRTEIIAVRANENLKAQGSGVLPTPLNCGSPCTNPGFESGSGFWDYYTGTACASATSDPCSIAPGFNSSAHVIETAGGFDPVVGGTLLPLVSPGGGGASLMIGNGAVSGNGASRASISFTVSAANANFTYRYACVLQDPGTSHTDPERPYFNVHLRDGSGNLIMCGEYMVMAKPPVIGFTETSPGSTIWWRNWTTVIVPLSSYIGQCVTIQFTSSDCTQGGHYGYAYIDGDCDPLTILSSSPSICGGASVTLTAPVGAAGYDWTNTAGGTTGIVGATTNSTCVVNAAGTYQCVITSAAGPSCTTILTITIGTGPASPVASFTNTTVCAGLATTFTDTSTPAGSTTAWSWDFNGDGTPDATTQNPTYTFPAAGTYPVTLVVSLGSCNATITQNVTVNPAVPPTINPAGPYCSNATPVNMVGNPAGGTWSGTGITNATAGTFDPTVASVGNNTITYTVAGACGGSMTATVVVNAVPVTGVNSVTICAGQTATLTATGIGTFMWNTGSAANPLSVTPAITTSYTVTATNAGCTGSAVSTVTVNPLPVLVITNPAPVCSPGTVDITASAVTAGSSGGGVLSYWTDAAATIGLAAPNAIATSGTYYIQSTTVAGCTDVAPVTATVNPLPVSIAGPDISFCSGSTGNIGVAPSAGNTYSWLATTGLSSAAISNPTVTLTTGGTSTISTYTVTTTIAATGCSTTDQVVVTVNPLPVLVITDPAAVCSPSTVYLTAAAVTAGSSISGSILTYWTNAAATIALASPSAVTTTGTYYIHANAGGGCTDIQPVNVVVNPLPISTAGPDVTICTGGVANLGGAATAGETYSWLSATGLSSTAISNPTVSLINAGGPSLTTTYTVTTTNSTTGCVSTDVVDVTVDAVATANAGSPQSVCSGTGITLAGAVGGSASGGTWSGGAGTFFPNNTTLNAVYTASAGEYASGTVTLTLTTNDPTGPCTFASSSVTFTFFQNPVINFSVNDPNGCPTHCVQFADASTVSGGNVIVGWLWDFGEGGIDSAVQNPSNCYDNISGSVGVSSFYDVTLTAVSNNGCSSTLTMPSFIEVYPEPVAEFTPNPNPASILNPVVTLSDGSTSDVISWMYYFGDGDSLGYLTPSPTHTYPDVAASTYLATLLVVNSFGCIDSVQHYVEIGPEFTFFIPNAFTPNSDGTNDFFFGQGIGIVDYDLFIFDRWGNEIFHGHDLNDMWNGKANGGSDIAQQDVYVWTVKLTDVFGKKHNYIGTVTLVK